MLASTKASVVEQWQERSSSANDAVASSSQLGIYAVPVKCGGQVYWRPRLASGHDPELGWLLSKQPTIKGWLSWADAVNDLADHLGQ